MSQDQILNLIEKLRAQLIELVRFRPLSDPEVVDLSQELDFFLNEYHYLSQNDLHY